MRAMPSPTCSTVPTSERSVWTSYCSILVLRIDVISSGRSFKGFLSSGWWSVLFAVVRAARARSRRVDRTAGRLLDLGDDPLRLVLGQLERGRQLDGQPPLLLGHQPFELALDLAQLPAAVLLDGEQQEVAQQLVRPAEDVLEHLHFRARVELRVAEHRVELGHVVERRDEVAELLAHGREATVLLRGLEEGARVGAVGDAHAGVFSSSALKSSDSIASSISRRWSAASSTLPVTFETARTVSSATSCRITVSERAVSASI